MVAGLSLQSDALFELLARWSMGHVLEGADRLAAGVEEVEL